MFDFFQIIDFNGKHNIKDKRYSFRNLDSYDHISGEEYYVESNNLKVCYLEREKTNKNIFSDEGKDIFVFGTVYTNNAYSDLAGVKPQIFYAEYISKLIDKYDNDFVKFIKGSFVIVFYYKKENIVKIVTDRLNVLPLYYSYKDNLLVISSSIRMILNTGYISKDINTLALVQQMIFDYVLGSTTYYKEISRVENGMIYIFNGGEIIEKKYWNVEELYNEKLLPRTDSLEMLSTQLHENTNLYCSDSKKILAALTGGFDGRANLALLDKNPEDFLCYSYGMPGSKQIEVPKMIAEKLKINYSPILLDEKYESEHDTCTDEAIEFSNGNAPIMRSNYPYAYKILNSYSKTILTGLFGSEVMRPLHNLGIMMNNYSEKLFLSDAPKMVLKEILKDIKRKKYILDKIIDENEEELIENIYSEYFEKYKKYDKVLKFFFFLLQEGVRKYFSQEIQIERVYVTTRFPFFDDDFVKLMYKSPFAGMYNGFLGKSKFKRRKGQLLYAYIYKKFKPDLGKIELDRGYKPDDLLRPFPINFLVILQGIRRNNAYKKLRGNDAFDSVKWTRGFIENTIKDTNDTMNVFGRGIKDNFKSGEYKTDLLKYSHLISLYKYLNSI